MPVINSTLIGRADQTGRGSVLIEFHDGSRYEYSGMSLQTFQSMCESESPGRFFNENIRGKYEERKIG